MMIKRNLCFGLAAAFVLFLNTRALDAGTFNKKSRKSREQVSPAHHPTFGYHQTRWRRFPCLPPCDNCNACPAGTCKTGSCQDGNDRASICQPQHIRPFTAPSIGWSSPTQGSRYLAPSISPMTASPSPQTAHPVPHSSGEPNYSSVPAALPPVPPVSSQGAQSQTFLPTQPATSGTGAGRYRMAAQSTRPAAVYPQAVSRQITSTSPAGPSRTASKGRYRMIGAPAQPVPVHTQPMALPVPSNPSGMPGFGGTTPKSRRAISTPLLKLPPPQPQI